MKSKSNPDFLKTDRSCVGRQLRGLQVQGESGGLHWVCRAHQGLHGGSPGCLKSCTSHWVSAGLQAERPLHSSRTVSSVTAGLPGAVLSPDRPRTSVVHTDARPRHFPPHGPLLPAHPSTGRWAEGGVPSLLHLDLLCVCLVLLFPLTVRN